MKCPAAILLIATACNADHGGFSDAVEYGTDGARIAAAADFDRDGTSDVVALHYLQDEYGDLPYGARSSVFRGTSNMLAVMTTQPSCVYPRIVVTGDWNADGRADYLIACESDMEGAGLRATTSAPGNQYQTTDISMPGLVSAIGVGDFNEDGVDDVAFTWSQVLHPSGAIGGIDVRFGPDLNNGTTYMAASGTPAGEVVAVGDLNNDGHVDVLLPAGARFGDGTGALGDAVSLDVQGTLVSGAVLDVDGDGLQDLVGATVDGVRVFRGDASGGLTPGFSASASERFFRMAPVPGVDDPPAIIVTDGGHALVFDNLGGGQFASPVRVSIPGRGRVIATGDFNGDRWTDLVVDPDGTSFAIMYGEPRD